MLRIRVFRMRAVLRQQDLAARLNVSWMSVSRWERGVRYPRLKYLKRMSELFSESMDSLLEVIPDEDAREVVTRRVRK